MRTDAPNTVAIDNGIASCSVNSPSRVNNGTRTAPPPIPAADARTVAKKIANAQIVSVREGGKVKSASSGDSRLGAWKRW